MLEVPVGEVQEKDHHAGDSGKNVGADHSLFPFKAPKHLACDL